MQNLEDGFGCGVVAVMGVILLLAAGPFGLAALGAALLIGLLRQQQ